MPFSVAVDLVSGCKLKGGLWAAWFSVCKRFEWSGALPDGCRDGCSVCRIKPAVSPVVNDSSVSGPYEEHLNSGDQALVVLHPKVRDREVLLE